MLSKRNFSSADDATVGMTAVGTVQAFIGAVMPGAAALVGAARLAGAVGIIADQGAQ
jgi:hypothetical protein